MKQKVIIYADSNYSIFFSEQLMVQQVIAKRFEDKFGAKSCTLA